MLDSHSCWKQSVSRISNDSQSAQNQFQIAIVTANKIQAWIWIPNFGISLKPNWIFFQKSLWKLFPLTTRDRTLGIRWPFVVFAVFSRIIWQWFSVKALFYYTYMNWSPIIGVVYGVVDETKAWLQLLSQYFVTLSSLWQKSLFPDSNIRTENISIKSYDSYVM